MDEIHYVFHVPFFFSAFDSGRVSPSRMVTGPDVSVLTTPTFPSPLTHIKTRLKTMLIECVFCVNGERVYASSWIGMHVCVCVRVCVFMNMNLIFYLLCVCLCMYVKGIITHLMANNIMETQPWSEAVSSVLSVYD